MDLDHWLRMTASGLMSFAVLRVYDLVVKPRPPKWRDVLLMVGASIGIGVMGGVLAELQRL